MTILALGDSYTFGAELADVPTNLGFYGNDYYDPAVGAKKLVKPSQLAWPSLLGKELNIPVENLALVGGSNDRIYRLAVDRCSLKNYSLVICAWTTLGRLDLQYHGRDIAVSSQCYFDFKWVREYTAQHYDDLIDCKKWLINLLTLQAYFEQKQQPYVFIKSFDTVVPKILHYLSEQIQLDKCVAWETDMYQLTADLPRGTNNHTLEQGHQRIADLLKQHIIQNKVIG